MITSLQPVWNSCVLCKGSHRHIPNRHPKIFKIEKRKKRKKKSENVIAFQPSIKTRQNPVLLCGNWVIMPCAGGAWRWNPQAVNEVAGHDAHIHTHTASATAIAVSRPGIWRRWTTFFGGELTQLHKGFRRFALTFLLIIRWITAISN